MDAKKLKRLKRQIQVAASLTSHQAGRVTGAVLTVLGAERAMNMIHTNRTRKDCDRGMTCTNYSPSACIDCLIFVPVQNASESHGPSSKESKEIIRQTQAKLPRSKNIQHPEDCVKDCNGPLCNGCPDFIPTEDRIDEIHTFASTLNKENIPPFELDEPDKEGITIDIPVGSFILTPKEFELIRKPLEGVIKSSINEKINLLRKYMDKPEKIQEMIEDILTVSKLSFKLNKL